MRSFSLTPSSALLGVGGLLGSWSFCSSSWGIREFNTKMTCRTNGEISFNGIESQNDARDSQLSRPVNSFTTISSAFCVSEAVLGDTDGDGAEPDTSSTMLLLLLWAKPHDMKACVAILSRSETSVPKHGDSVGLCSQRTQYKIALS
eukprot:TRINITY_DN380_c0_g1_i1.p1 TRINITY_DN380_c0_g1~~TRINITY_DN380_c0_g1_i1.p1  ORF type:complete len:147 (-),score=15.04 TRINITY_DN380_c0_g1_i1:42-482(-)